MTDTPVILSTLGDAGGVGPELVARTLDHPEITRGCKRVIAGHPRIFDMGREVAGVATDLPRFTDIEAAIASPDPVVFYHFDTLHYGDIDVGKTSAQAGLADYQIGCHAADLSAAGLIDAFVWAPVNKASIHKAGHHFEGYKAGIADYMGFAERSTEINTIGHLWTTRVTSHIPISAIAGAISEDAIFDVLTYFDRELRRFGYADPRIAVSGLNPHNGDEGAFGREEIDVLRPAIEAMQEVAPRGFRVQFDLTMGGTDDHMFDLLERIAEFPIAGCFEDPLPTKDIEGHIELRNRSGLPIVLHHSPLGATFEVMRRAGEGLLTFRSPACRK
ncbi:4-hydroxythreonine-4-phosphate dehydrogenase PdxA, partial [Marinovum algicola]|uniref:4-hydroxythreonine-4-phosphate dehydrogenase PdxA n=1 Tax=Marinovum algicola TaxID=42444 RepID=UPI0024B8D32C